MVYKNYKNRVVGSDLPNTQRLTYLHHAFVGLIFISLMFLTVGLMTANEKIHALDCRVNAESEVMKAYSDEIQTDLGELKIKMDIIIKQVP
jgi:hypothetical protein